MANFFSNVLNTYRFVREIQKRSATVNTPPNWKQFWLDWGQEAASGEKVDEDTAITFSAIYACVSLISSTIASLPLNVYKRTGEGRELVSDHPLYDLLHNNPNENMTSFVWRETSMTHLGLWGNAYSRIVKKDGRASQLIPLQPKDVEPKFNQRMFYAIEGRGTPLPARDMLHIPGLGYDGLIGKSPLVYAKDAMGYGLALQRFGSKFMANGANLSGVLEFPGTLTEDQMKRIAKSWKDKYESTEKANKTAILENGMKYTRIGIEPEAAQFIQSRKFSVEEIARIYRVPLHLIQNLDKATFNNVEELSRLFSIYTIRPWIVKIEQELNRKLLLEEEKGKYYIEFDLEGLLRGDAKTRAEFYRTLVNIGMMAPNEGRKKENLPPYDGGDKKFIQSNMIPVEMAGQNFKSDEQGSTGI